MWSSEVDLAVRLHELGLLPEEDRKTFVHVVSEYAVSGEDVYALGSEGIRSMFTPAEFDALVATVRTMLIPNLDEMREREQAGYRGSEPAEEHLDHLFESLRTLMDTFGDDAEAGQLIEREFDRARDWITDNDRERPEPAPRSLDAAEVEDKPQGARSIFDDIDV